MPRLLRIYGALMRASWTKALEYRAQVVLWVISGIFPLVMMAVLRVTAFCTSSGGTISETKDRRAGLSKARNNPPASAVT